MLFDDVKAATIKFNKKYAKKGYSLKTVILNSDNHEELQFWKGKTQFIIGYSELRKYMKLLLDSLPISAGSFRLYLHPGDNADNDLFVLYINQ